MKTKSFKNCYFYDAGDGTITISTSKNSYSINFNDLKFTTTNNNQIVKLQAVHNDISYTFAAHPEAPYIQ